MKLTVQQLAKLCLMITKYSILGFFLQVLAMNTILAEKGKAQRLSDIVTPFNFEGVTVAEAMEIIEKSTDFKFVYNAKKLKLRQKLNFSTQNSTLADVLLEISEEAGLKFKQINDNIAVSAIERESFVSFEDPAGLIVGRVVDEQNGEPLPGATVKIVGTNRGTSTDLDGSFRLSVKGENISLEINYIGYASKTETVTLAEGEILELKIALVSKAFELEGVTVVGNLQGQQKALNQQKSADNIKNIVAADQIGRFPDPNVAEALQRVPGASVERDQGEGRYVLVRGLAPQFTNVSINGEQIPSPEAGIRYIALDAVPADQLASIEVTKALTPDMDGDAVSGSVNLVTRKATGREPDISASIIGGYNQLMNQPNGQGSLQYGQRFGQNEKFGMLVNSSYYFTDRGSDNWERDGDEFELRDYELTRTRLGLSGTLDYRFNSNNEIYFRGIYNRFSDREWRRRYVFVPNTDDSPFEDNEIERLTKDRFEIQKVESYNLGGRHSFPKLFLDYEVAYATAEQDTPFDNEVKFLTQPSQLSIDFASDPDFPSFAAVIDEDDPELTYLNNSIYEFDELETGNTLAQDENITAKVNFGIPYQLMGKEGLLKFGSKVRFKEKTFDVVQNVFEWQGSEDLILSDFEGGLLDDNFLDGRYQLALAPDMARVLNHFNANRAGYELQTEDKLVAEANESYVAEEDVYAAYIMTKLQLNKLMVLGGVRYEKTDVKYRFNTVTFDLDGDLESITPESGGTDYDFWLPQLHFKYELTEKTNLRLAATYSYSRPNFEDIVPTQEIELNDRQGTIGNPELLPVSAFNLDLLGEKYFGTVGVVSGGLFYKRLDNFIFQRRFFQDFDGVPVFITQSSNGETANLFGIEVAYQQNLTFLPGVLKGIGLYFNYTYTSSDAEIIARDTEVSGVESISLPGQADHIGNLSFSYDYKGFNTRLSLNYNGSYLTEVGEDASADIYINDRLQVDLTAQYTISPKFRVFAEFLNLTNAPFEAYQESEDQLIQREFYSWWSRVGVKFDL